MLLENKTAIVYGAAGSIGSAVARAYAREGAAVHLVGRTHQTLDRVAGRIRGDGGTAQVAQLDVLDPAAVEQHANTVAGSEGIDICFNATSNDDVQGVSLDEIDFDDFMRPVIKAVSVHLIIARAVARHMVPHRGGVILVMAGGREAIPNLGGSHVAWSALAGLCRQLASELGPRGVRVAWLLSPGSSGQNESDLVEAKSGNGGPLLLRRPTYDDVANAAVFASSDWARTMTATEINLTGGLVLD
jgi:NAD(P)-dependent dehydrogenase (short-subunit alcohol dehydrogenase family)